jgi:hypothetical protein
LITPVEAHLGKRGGMNDAASIEMQPQPEILGGCPSVVGGIAMPLTLVR